MPSTYAHNKFGKLVIAKLSGDTKDIIRKIPDSFRIGLQGPDFLFFYRAFYINKINQTGVKHHRQDVYDFMEHAVSVIKKYGKNSPEYSYILGFICHFTLDCNCHPYVNKFMEITGCGHVEIEGDLEHLMISKDNYIPQYYPMDYLIPANRETALSMVSFYENLSSKIILESLKWMKFLKRFFVAPGFFKRHLIDTCFHMTMNYKKLNGHVIKPGINKKCRQQTKFLYKVLRNSVKNAVFLINDFNNAVERDTSLSNEFHKDFNGNPY